MGEGMATGSGERDRERQRKVFLGKGHKTGIHNREAN